VLTLTISLPEYRYKDPVAQRRFFAEAIDAVAAVPGVAVAGFVNVLPFSTYNRGTRYVADDATHRSRAASRQPTIASSPLGTLPRWEFRFSKGDRSTHEIAIRRTAWPSSTERLHVAHSPMPRPSDDAFASAVRHLERRG
jgi:hypothetical protein